MLKKSFTLALAVMLMMTLSCRKVQQVSTFNKKGGNTAALRLAPEEPEAVTNDFITQSLSQQWNLGTYEYEDVVLILEGALNYRTCTQHKYYDEIAIDSASRFITIEQTETDGPWVVNPEVLIEAWKDLLTHAQETAERLENGEYFNIVADLEIGHVDYEAARIRVSVVLVAGINIYDIRECDFDPNTDYWNSAVFGPCNQGSGCFSLGSWDIIQMKLNPFLNCFENYNCDYFSDISWKTFSNYYPPWPPYNQCGTGCNSLSDIWMGTYNQCLTPSELECERDAIRSLSYCNKPLVSGSLVQYKLPILYEVTVDPFYTNPQVAFHGARVYYGKCSSYTSEN